MTLQMPCLFWFLQHQKRMAVTKNLCIPYMFPFTFFSSYLHTKSQFHAAPWAFQIKKKGSTKNQKCLSTFYSSRRGILPSTHPSQAVWPPIASDYKNPINGKLSREQNLSSQNTGRYKSRNWELMRQDYLKIN